MNLKGKQVIAEFGGEEKPTTEEMCTIAAVSGGRVVAVRHSDGEIVSLDPLLPLRLVDHDRALRRLDPEMDAMEAKAVADHAADLQAQLEETAKRCGQLRTDLATEMQQGLELRDQVNQAVTRILAAVPGWFTIPPTLDIAVDALLRAMAGSHPGDEEIRVLVGARDEETTTDAVRRRVEEMTAATAGLRASLEKEVERHQHMRKIAEDDREQLEEDAQAMSAAIGRLTAMRQAADSKVVQLEAMVRGLGRAALFIEQDKTSWLVNRGEIYDSTIREALETARKHGYLPVKQARVAELTTGRPFVDVVFDGPPGPDAGRFVEVEDDAGKSINAGVWIDRKDGMWALRIPINANRTAPIPAAEHPPAKPVTDESTPAGQDAPVSHGRALSTALVEAIAAGRAGYRVNPDDAIRHAQALASEVLAYRAAAPAAVNAEQPDPKYDPAKPDVWETVIRAASLHAAPPDLIAAMRARRALGIARYGTPLQPHNGRSARRDLLEELLDATAYSGQDALERGTDLTDPLFMYILGLLVRVHKESVRPA